MGLSADLISQFAKLNKGEKPKSEATVYGTTVEYDGKMYVRLDGSELLTPVNTTVKTNADERVTVLIKNHTATVTGNLSSPAARTGDVEEIGNQITEFEIVVADKVSTKQLEVEQGRIDQLFAEDVTVHGLLDAAEANIGELEADNVTIHEQLTAAEADISKLSTDKLDATIAQITYATIGDLEATNIDVHNLEATYGEFADLTTDRLTAIDAEIKRLDTETLTATEASLMYANIDFSNIGKAAIEEFFAKSGMIKDVVVGDGTITGELVGVTIKGDLIEGGTVKADKLVIKGTDGLYYKLNTDGETVEKEQTEYNSLDGKHILAKSITATKISVKDLVAFDATIGGFKITDHSLYSGVKESVNNTTRGAYLDDSGQIAFGDETNYLKYYKASDGTYRLEISASNILFKSGKKSVEEAVTEIENKVNNISVGARNLIRNSKNMIFEDYWFYEPEDEPDEEIVVTDDGAGNVTVVYSLLTVTDDSFGNVTFSGVNTTHDGNGNVTITK